MTGALRGTIETATAPSTSPVVITVLELMKRYGLPRMYATRPARSFAVGTREACIDDSTRGVAQKARLLGRSGTVGREQIGLRSLLAPEKVGDELTGRGRERQAVAGEPGVHEHAARVAADVRKRIVREAHRPGPVMRDLRLRTTLAKETGKLLLDA